MLFIDGFDYYRNPQTLYKWDAASNVHVAANAGRRGGGSATPTASDAYLKKSISGQYAVIGFAIRRLTTDAFNVVFSAESVDQFIVAFNAFGAIQIDTTISNAVIAHDDWFYVEIGLSPTAYEVRVNGSALDWHPNTTGDVGSGFDEVRIEGSVAGNWLIDDLYMATSETGLWWIGPCRVDALEVIGDGASQDWTPSAEPAWSQLTQLAGNLTGGGVSTFKHRAIAHDDPIIGAQVSAWAEDADASALVLTLGTQESAEFTLSEAMAGFSFATTAITNKTDINAAEIGVSSAGAPPPPSGDGFILYAVYNDDRPSARLLKESGGVITECELPTGFRPSSVSPSQRLGMFGNSTLGIIVGGNSSADFGATAIASMDAGETWEIVSWGNGQQLETPCVGVISLGNLVATEDYYKAYSYSPTANGAWVNATESPGWQWFRLCALADFKSQLYAAFIEGPDGQMAIRRTSSITPGSWETVDTGDISITDSNFLYFTTDGNRLLLLSENGYIRYSDNGSDWTTLPSRIPGRFNAAICGGGNIVLVGLNDTDAPDGTDYPHQIFAATIADLTFSAYSVPGRLINSSNYNEKYFIDATYGEGQFTALAVDGTVIKFSDPDSISVSNLTAPSGGWFCGVRYFEAPE